MVNNIICQEVSAKPLNGLYEMCIYNHDTGFSEHPPYREILVWLAAHLQGSGHPTILDLPPVEADEEQVDGSIVIDQERFEVYFDTALAYISWYSRNRVALIKVARLIHNLKPQLAG